MQQFKSESQFDHREAEQEAGLKLAVDSLYLGMSRISRDSEELNKEKSDGYWVVKTNLNNPEFNAGLVVSGEDENQTQVNIRTVLDKLHVESYPSILFVSDKIEDFKLLEEAGYKQDGESALMSLTLSDFIELRGDLSSSTEYSVEPVTNLAGLEIAIGLQSETLAFDKETIERTLGRKAVEDPGILTLVARSPEGIAVGSMMIVFDGESASIWNMGTIEEHKRKGVATSMAIRAIDFCAKQGVKNFYLLATEEGESFYEKLGFKTFDRTKVFVSDAE